MAAATATVVTADIIAIVDMVDTEVATTAPQSGMPAHGSASSWADRIPAIRTAATSVIDITVTTDADITVVGITAITAITKA